MKTKVYEVVLDRETNKIYDHVKQPQVIEAATTMK